MVTPSSKAIAGDYMTTFRANAKGESGSVDFRVSVKTSTMWGIVGLAVIAVALLVLMGAVARFGRRKVQERACVRRPSRELVIDRIVGDLQR